jgi:alkaline phosphatase D
MPCRAVLGAVLCCGGTYRARHAFYRAERPLQELSASAPLIAVWDDHDLANDAWVRAQIDSDGQCGAYRVDVRAKLGAK